MVQVGCKWGSKSTSTTRCWKCSPSYQLWVCSGFGHLKLEMFFGSFRHQQGSDEALISHCRRLDTKMRLWPALPKGLLGPPALANFYCIVSHRCFEICFFCSSFAFHYWLVDVCPRLAQRGFQLGLKNLPRTSQNPSKIDVDIASDFNWYVHRAFIDVRPPCNLEKYLWPRHHKILADSTFAT